MGNGTAILRHVASGCEVHLLCATRGGAGWNGLPEGRRPEELADIRNGELERAAAVLGLAGVELWDYPDGAVAGCDLGELTARIEASVRRLDPAVVCGWGPDGAYGHPDHVAVGACTDTALAGSGRTLYHLAVDSLAAAAFEAWLAIAMPGEGMRLTPVDRVDIVFEPTAVEYARVRQAVECHASQLNQMYRAMLGEDEAFRWFARNAYVRVQGTAIQAAGEIFPELA